MAAHPPDPRYPPPPPPAGQAYCRACGALNPATQAACSRCGRPLAGEGAVPVGGAAETPPGAGAAVGTVSAAAHPDGPGGAGMKRPLPTNPYAPPAGGAPYKPPVPPAPPMADGEAGRPLGLAPRSAESRSAPPSAPAQPAPPQSAPTQPAPPQVVNPQSAIRNPQSVVVRLQDLDVERFYPNNMGRFVFLALEELLGRNGLNAVLNLAGLGHFINNYPPSNMEKRFSFAHYAAVNQAIEDFYGVRGSKGLLLRVGKVSLTHALSMYTAFAGIGNLSMRVLPQSAKVKLTLTVIAQTFRTLSDQVSKVTEEPEAYIFENETCSMCWRRTATQPCCHIATGVLVAALHWATGKNYRVIETQCMAMGAPTCRFVIDKQPLE